MKEKECTYCKKIKAIDCYYKQRRGLYGVTSHCKMCCKELGKLSKQNWAKLNEDRLKLYYKEWAKGNKDKLLENSRSWRAKNIEKSRERSRIFNIENKEKIYEHTKDRLSNDPIFRLGINVKSLIRNSFGRVNNVTARKAKRTEEILGCSVEEFMTHIESKFTDGMTFENHVRYGWHLDHKIPLAVAKTEEDIYKLNHYSNFQPLWAADNFEKRDKPNWQANNTVTVITV